MKYQNLAYCRFLHIWMTFYFLNLISLSPIISFYLTSIFHFFNIFHSTSSRSKTWGLVLSDIIILYFLNRKSSDLHICDNILMFTFYNLLLEIYNYFYNDHINIITLHCEKLKEDDLLHKEESYFIYLKRVWNYMFNTFIIFN